MADVVERRKPLAVSPLRASRTLGAALAFLGFRRAIPMLHGSPGCTAFGKVFLVRHFREPIPLQTTALDEISAVMGPGENVVEGLRTLCGRSRPALIGLPTTALAETQGSDTGMAIREFRRRFPEYDDVVIVPVSAPEYAGSLEEGFADASRAVLAQAVPTAAEAGTRPGRRESRVNVLAGAHLTPGDLEELKEWIGLFGLTPAVVPDLSDSLDGHLAEEEWSPLTLGGTEVGELAHLGDARATIVIGRSMGAAADVLRERTGVPDHRLEHGMGLRAADELVLLLRRLSGRATPARLERQRAQLQDAMLDTHFALSTTRFAIAAEADLLHAFSELLAGVGAETVAAVAPTASPVLERSACGQVTLGDLEDLEVLARRRRAEILIGSSHAAESARRLGIPLVRAGLPQHDRIGAAQRTWLGYRGTRDALFELANVAMELERGAIAPYRSVYATTPQTRREDRRGTLRVPAGATARRGTGIPDRFAAIGAEGREN